MAVSAGRRMARAAAAAGLAAMLLVEGVAARKHMNEFKRMPGHKQLEQVKSPRVRTILCFPVSWSFDDMQCTEPPPRHLSPDWVRRFVHTYATRSPCSRSMSCPRVSTGATWTACPTWAQTGTRYGMQGTTSQQNIRTDATTAKR